MYFKCERDGIEANGSLSAKLSLSLKCPARPTLSQTTPANQLEFSSPVAPPSHSTIHCRATSFGPSTYATVRSQSFLLFGNQRCVAAMQCQLLHAHAGARHYGTDTSSKLSREQRKVPSCSCTRIPVAGTLGSALQLLISR
eukprot:6175949-Pleurochrysis_carterae.AAC.1